MSEDLYKVESNKLRILDKKAGVDLTVDFSPVALSTPEERLTPGYSIVTDKEANWVALNGKPAGEWRGFHRNGEIKLRCFYELSSSGVSRLHGPCERYNDRGMLLSRGYYVKGKRQGREERFYTDGSCYAICFYRDGVPVADHRYFYRNGNPKTVIPNPSGATVLYDMDGGIKREVH